MRSICAWAGVLLVCLALTNCSGATSSLDPSRTRAAPMFTIPNRSMNIGTAVAGTTESPALRDSNYTAWLGREFNSLTPENQMKWRVIHPNPGKFDFAPMDEIANFARDHNQQVRGHTLLWHGGNPEWLGSKLDCQQAREILREHIYQVVSRYRDIAYEWDVANEVMNSKGNLRTDENPFLRACGEEIIDAAFHWTKAVDPEADLYLNDYGLEMPGPKIDGTLELARRMKARGAPVDGLGFQGHVILGQESRWTLRRNMDRAASLGLKVAITEAEVRIRTDRPPSSEEQKAQAAAYARLIEGCLGTPRCETFSLWGFTDAHSWANDLEGQRAATILDEKYRPKPAYFALVQALSRWRSAAPSTK